MRPGVDNAQHGLVQAELCKPDDKPDNKHDGESKIKTNHAILKPYDMG